MEKFVSPSNRGVPDRILMLPGARLCFVEFKAPGKKPTELQKKRHDQYRALGFRVEVIDNVEAFRSLLQAI